ncbi:MAG: peroxiredoxin [Cyanobacteria bacterium P01_F01_bin.150]
MATPVKVGDRAPAFTLSDQSGKSVNLENMLGQKPIVLYFYPKDDTPGCTKESCAFRDSYEVFQKAGAEVIGISGDSSESHEQFASKYNLPFTLLADTGNKVRSLYGVPATLFFLPGRVTYIIDQKGVVQSIFNSMLDFNGHVNEAIKVIENVTD